MNTKQFNRKDVANIKRYAAMSNDTLNKIEKINEKIKKLQEQAGELTEQFEMFNEPVKKLTGYGILEILEKQITETEKDGKVTKTSKWVLKYPETIIPSVSEEELTINETINE